MISRMAPQIASRPGTAWSPALRQRAGTARRRGAAQVVSILPQQREDTFMERLRARDVDKDESLKGCRVVSTKPEHCKFWEGVFGGTPWSARSSACKG